VNMVISDEMNPEITRHASLVILEKRSAERSPLTTLYRREGLLLSFKLTYKLRILLLYGAVVPSNSSSTAASMAFARDRISSTARIDVN
jgi:hypothetical protein